MNISDLVSAVKTASDAIYKNEQFVLPLLAVRARKAAEVYPEDTTIVTAANVFSRMEEKGQNFISRADLKKIYNDLYVNNTRFAEVFAEEVGGSELATPKYLQHDSGEDNFIESSFKSVADPVLANALDEVFKDNGELKLYSSDLAVKAEKACYQELSTIGVAPKRIGIFAGQSDMLVCKASFETPKGISDVLIPIEVSNGKPLLPTMFLSSAGFIDLKAVDLKQHILNTAGKSYNVDGEALLKVLCNAKFGAPSELSDVDRAIMKVATEKGTPSSFAMDGIVYQQIETVKKDLELPKYEQPEEVQSFANRLNSARGGASFLFGEKIVNAGSGMIQRTLAGFGIKNTQISVVDNDENTIYYAVSLGSAGMNVPVSIKNGVIQTPQVVLAAGEMYDFTADGVKKVLTSKNKDARMMGVASPNYDLKPIELIQQIKIAMDEGKHVGAEDALAVLAAQGDEVAYQAGLAAYMNGLNMGNKLAKQASKLEEKVETPLLIDYKVFL